MALKSRLTWVSQHQKHTIHIQLSAPLSLLLIPSNHFPPFTTIHSIIVNHSYSCSQPLSLYFPGSFNLQSNISSPSHLRPFLKHAHTISVYFSGPLLLSSILTTALI